MTTADTTRAMVDAWSSMAMAIQEQAVQALGQSQVALVETTQAWATAAQRLASPPPAEVLDQLPRPSELIDRGFEIAEQILAAQRAFVRQLVEAAESAAVQTAGPAASAAAATATAASSGSGSGGAAGTVAGDAAAAGTAAAADGATTITETVKNVFRGS